MITDRKLSLSLAMVVWSSCALPPPPAPRDIDCEEIDRADERFPEECGGDEPADADAGGDLDAGSGGE